VVLNDTAIIRELAVADLLKLTQILQPTLPAERAARVEQLVQEIAHAISEDRREWAVGRFIEAATSDPSRVDELLSRPDFESIRPNAEVLLNRLTNVAKMDAETKLTTAEQTMETGGWQKLAQWETAPEALIQIGHRLIEAGGYANYVRTAELATTLQAAYWSANVVDPPIQIANTAPLKDDDTITKRRGAKGASLALAYHAWDLMREKLPIRVEALWNRAPLLIILGAWFGAGVMGLVFSSLVKAVWPDSWVVTASDFGFKLWSIGLLAIVGFGFWARVRKSRGF
jgi:hypothetical protein